MGVDQYSWPSKDHGKLFPYFVLVFFHQRSAHVSRTFWSTPTYGCGSKPTGSHFGVFGAPPMVEPTLAGIGMFTDNWDSDPWPYGYESSAGKEGMTPKKPSPTVSFEGIPRFNPTTLGPFPTEHQPDDAYSIVPNQSLYICFTSKPDNCRINVASSQRSIKHPIPSIPGFPPFPFLEPQSGHRFNGNNQSMDQLLTRENPATKAIKLSYLDSQTFHEKGNSPRHHPVFTGKPGGPVNTCPEFRDAPGCCWAASPTPGIRPRAWPSHG